MNQLQAYQFIQYNHLTTIEDLQKVYETGAIICFDFEDGIVDPMNAQNNEELKNEARKQFHRLYELIREHIADCSIGVRINSIHSFYINDDFLTLTEKSIDIILLPKIEKVSDLNQNIQKITVHNIKCKKIIPIIETKKGFENFSDIIKSFGTIINSYAFGHCDYNLSIRAYPFFHQDSWEYWKWINYLCDVAGSDVEIINSPYLNVDNKFFFTSMLKYITEYKKSIKGQVTLSTKQSEWCKNNTQSEDDFESFLSNKNLISVDQNQASLLIAHYEKYNKTKGLTKYNGEIISLQEFKASKRFLEENEQTIDLCFIGGCFPVQYNILFEDLFHQKLKRKLADSFDLNLQVNIIRYERFYSLNEKLNSLIQKRKIDILIFHVRPEIFLRFTKLLYKYTNDKGAIKRVVNFPLFHVLRSEQFDILEISQRFRAKSKKKESKFHPFLLTCNYLFGIGIGNYFFAVRKYQKEIMKMKTFCDQNSIKFCVLGPNCRNGNVLESKLCRFFDRKISKISKNSPVISGFEELNQLHPVNFENGIHVTPYYHELIAEKLFNFIKDEVKNSLMK
jgi:hypothetical protein